MKLIRFCSLSRICAIKTSPFAIETFHICHWSTGLKISWTRTAWAVYRPSGVSTAIPAFILISVSMHTHSIRGRSVQPPHKPGCKQFPYSESGRLFIDKLSVTYTCIMHMHVYIHSWDHTYLTLDDVLLWWQSIQGVGMRSWRSRVAYLRRNEFDLTKGHHVEVRTMLEGNQLWILSPRYISMRQVKMCY